MIAEQIAMVGKETDENVLRVRSRLDRIKDSPETIVQISDLAVVTGLDDFRQCRVNGFRPNGVSHEGNLFVQVIRLEVAEDWLQHSIWVVHPVERNRRSQWRIRPNERPKPKERAGILLCYFFPPPTAPPPSP